jgi:predicted DCC family thiol-disulfide oxidoreductase YuxK
MEDGGAYRVSASPSSTERGCMNKLYILYDVQCPFVLRCRGWLGDQTALVNLEFIPFQTPHLVWQFKGIEAYPTKNQLLVINENGGVYEGPNAFIMCLWALEKYREMSVRLSSPALLPMAREAFELLSSGGKGILQWMAGLDDQKLANVLHYQVPPPLEEAVVTRVN